MAPCFRWPWKIPWILLIDTRVSFPGAVWFNDWLFLSEDPAEWWSCWCPRRWCQTQVYNRHLAGGRWRTVFSPLSQEMAVFKSISGASCVSLTSCPCTNACSQGSVTGENRGSSLMKKKQGLTWGWRGGCVEAEPLYASCGHLWFELVTVLVCP